MLPRMLAGEIRAAGGIDFAFHDAAGGERGIGIMQNTARLLLHIEDGGAAQRLSLIHI